MTSQPTLCWFLMSQAMERSPGSCGHGAASASWCQPPVCWASRPQLSLIPAVSVCLQQTCCASRCVKTPLRAEPDLNKGELWTSIFQEHFMFYLSRCCFRNHFPSCRAQKQEWRDASIYLTCLPLHKGRSQSGGAKMAWIFSFCGRWTITYLRHKCWWCVRYLES